jgi:hypothetical protein
MKVECSLRTSVNLYRMPSSGMLRRVVLIRTDVSDETSASIMRVTRIGELGTLPVTINRHTLRRNTSLVTLIMEALCSFETSVPTRATPRNSPENGMFIVTTLRISRPACYILLKLKYKNTLINCKPLARLSPEPLTDRVCVTAAGD